MRNVKEWPLSSVDIEPGSPFLPKRGTEADEILNRRSISLDFYKTYSGTLSDELTFLNTVGNDQNVDLRLLADGDNDKRSAAFSLKYDITDGSLLQWSSFMTPTTWKDTGKITSVPDLAGTTIIINWANLEDRHFELECLWLEVSQGRFIDIGRQSMKRYSSPRYDFDAPVFEYTFPQNLSNLESSCYEWHP
jgi:hypothetical protein